MQCMFYTQIGDYKFKCKKYDSFIISNKYICYNHAIVNYNKYPILIQKIWRGYRKRLFINKVYKYLPNDLQKKILFYVRENDLIKKYHHNVIKNILSKKFTKNDIINLEFYTGNQEEIHYQNNKLKYIIHIFNLYIKYNSIAPYYNKLILNEYLQDLIELVESLYLMYLFDNKLITELLNLLKKYKKLLLDNKFS